jgi:hypothetical protein
MVSFYILVSWVGFLGRCAGVVSPQELEADLTIYYENDLLGKLIIIAFIASRSWL